MAWTERYVRADAAGGGDGTTDAASGATGSWTLAEALTNAAAGQRINVKAGTYTLSGSITFANAGSTSTAILWQGFTSSVADLIDNFDSSAYPYIDATGGDYQVAISGASNWFVNLRIRGARTSANGNVYVTGNNTRFVRCYVEGTANDVDSNGIVLGSDGNSIVQSNVIAHTGAVSAVRMIAGATENIISGSRCHGGGGGGGGTLHLYSAGSLVIQDSLISGSSSIGIVSQYGTQGIQVFSGNTIHGTTGAGIHFHNAPLGGYQAIICNNVFSSCSTYGVLVNSGVSANVSCFNNLFYDCASGNMSNVLESFAVGHQSDSSSPFTNAGSGDFSLVASSNGVENGSPGDMVGFTTSVGYRDIGAFQRAAGGGGGGEVYG